MLKSVLVGAVITAAPLLSSIDFAFAQAVVLASGECKTNATSYGFANELFETKLATYSNVRGAGVEVASKGGCVVVQLTAGVLSDLAGTASPRLPWTYVRITVDGDAKKCMPEEVALERPLSSVSAYGTYTANFFCANLKPGKSIMQLQYRSSRPNHAVFLSRAFLSLHYQK
jgi:hypothetical protein